MSTDQRNFTTTARVTRLQGIMWNNFYSRPFIYFTILLIMGVFCGEGTSVDPVVPGVLAIVLLLAGIVFSGLGKQRDRLALAFLLAFFFLGWMRIRQEKILPLNHIQILPGTVTVEGVLYRPVQRYPKRTRLYLQAEKIILPSHGKGFPEKEQTVSGLIRLDSKVEMPSLKYGDRILVRTRLRQPTSYRNPGGFDYRS